MTKPRVTVGPGARFKFSPEYLAANGGAIVEQPPQKKVSKAAAKKLVAARIQRAINGFQIPMMSIPALYKALEADVAAGASDEQLKATVGAFPGVVEV